MPYAFKGANFDFDDYDLSDNPVLAAHFIHSVLWMRHTNGKITHWKTITFQEFWENNKDFLNAVVRKYKKERNYDIQEISVSTGMNWFLNSMKLK